MRAYQLHGVGDLRLCEIDQPALVENTVLVKVAACGVCSSDIPRVFVNGTYHFPTVPGHEFAGTVVQACDGAGEPWVGKRVGVFPLIPCKECDQCERGHYEMCRHYDYLGSRSDGGFAEYVRVPVWNLLALPDGLPLDQAAMLEPASVALHAAKAALKGIDPAGVRAAVSGSGAIGMLVGCWLAGMGCEGVTILGRNERKRALAEQLGLAYVDTSADDGGDALYDCIVEAVGSASSLAQCITRANAGARIVAMGNPHGDMQLSRDVYWKVLRSQLSIVGVWNSSYEHGEACEWSQAVDAMAAGKLDVSPLITHRFAFEKLPDALEVMRAGKELYGKVMVMFE